VDEGVCAGQGFRRRRDGSSGDERKSESCDRRDRQKVCDLDVWGVRRSTSRYLPIRTRIGDGRKDEGKRDKDRWGMDDQEWSNEHGDVNGEKSVGNLETHLTRGGRLWIVSGRSGAPGHFSNQRWR